MNYRNPLQVPWFPSCIRRPCAFALRALIAISAVSFSITTQADELTAEAKTPSARLEQRQHYFAALEALKRGHLKTFRNHFDSIGDYPLKNYLEYAELKRRLYLLPYEDVDKFLDRYGDSYLGDELNERWLSTLYRKKHWHDYQSYYSSYPNSSDRTVHQCQFLLARLYSGDSNALKEVEPLWNVGKSQPDECDPLFKAWLEGGYLSDEIAWERFHKAIDNREITLARYLLKRMPETVAPMAGLYLEMDRYPHRIKNRARFDGVDARTETIIHHGIRRYSRRDPVQALATWEAYDAQRFFEERERAETQQYLLTQLARRGHMDSAAKLLQQTKQITSQELVEWLVRDALREQDWQRVYDSINLLSQDDQQTERWLYWRARALEQLDIADPDYPTPKQIYSSLALTRGYYGFLSADILGHDYTMIDRPVNPPLAAMQAVSLNPALIRAGELLQIGELYDARREWLYATKKMPPDELLAAGKLAEQWGWYRKTIQAVVEARHWDDLNLRFPLAYQKEMDEASQKTQIASPLLFAIARQESAFAADARSSAGAMGLMQLMPATARQTARKIGVKYRYWDLIKPESNIRLGSSYLDQLLDEFNGNRILATAAYNAGPHRVKQWLSRHSKQVPYDVWIETIPFRETRGYVQNVLSFSVIYSYRLGNKETMVPGLKNGTQLVVVDQ